MRLGGFAGWVCKAEVTGSTPVRSTGFVQKFRRVRFGKSSFQGGVFTAISTAIPHWCHLGCFISPRECSNAAIGSELCEGYLQFRAFREWSNEAIRQPLHALAAAFEETPS
jgi:hypothetical protein